MIQDYSASLDKLLGFEITTNLERRSVISGLPKFPDPLRILFQRPIIGGRIRATYTCTVVTFGIGGKLQSCTLLFSLGGILV